MKNIIIALNLITLSVFADMTFSIDEVEFKNRILVSKSEGQPVSATVIGYIGTLGKDRCELQADFLNGKKIAGKISSVTSVRDDIYTVEYRNNHIIEELYSNFRECKKFMTDKNKDVVTNFIVNASKLKS